MKSVLKKFIKNNAVLLIITCIILIITALLCANASRIVAYFTYSNAIKNAASKNHKANFYDFSKIKVLKTEKGDYILVNDEKEDKSFDLISKNEIGSYAYETQGKYYTRYTESINLQRNKNIKKFEYDVFNLDKRKVTKKIDLKALLNKYCEDCWWTTVDIENNQLVYSVNGKAYITAGCVNTTNPYFYTKFFNQSQNKQKSSPLILKAYEFFDRYYAIEDFDDDSDDYYCGDFTYGGLYISLDQKEIVRSLLYDGKNERNVFQSVGESNSKLDSRDIKYNYAYKELNELKNKTNPIESNEKYFPSYTNNEEDFTTLERICNANNIQISFATEYTNPFCKVKIEFNSSDLKSNMTNLFNKYPELKKYVGVKGKKITLFDHDLENDDQVLQLFTPDGKPLSFAGVKDDKVGEITGVADYCQKMKAYNEAHPAENTQN